MNACDLRRAANAARRRWRGLRCAVRRWTGRPLRIHIENHWRLGDEILAIPFYELVRARYPGAAITVSVNYPELLDGQAHVAVDNSRTEFDCDRYLFARDDARSTPRLAHLCALHGIPHRDTEPAVALPRPARLPEPLPGAVVRLACSCGAGWACKSLPAGFLRELCALLARERPDIGFAEIGKGCPAAGVGVCYVDRLSVAETAHVLANCDLYIGPDSGLAHLALAVGTPALAFYGPVKPDRAFGARRRLHAVLSPVECQGCWTDGRMREPGVCPLGFRSDAPEDYPCMQAFDPALALRRILDGGLAAPARREAGTRPENQA